jgi:hypothetical protein
LCLGCMEWKKPETISNSEQYLSQMLDKVKLHFYQWLKTANTTLVLNNVIFFGSTRTI